MEDLTGCDHVRNKKKQKLKVHDNPTDVYNSI